MLLFGRLRAIITLLITSVHIANQKVWPPAWRWPRMDAPTTEPTIPKAVAQANIVSQWFSDPRYPNISVISWR
jgi:hypothetical protein